MLLIKEYDFTPDLLQHARDFFLREGRSDIVLKSPHSIAARYLLVQEMRKLGASDFLPREGIFQHGYYFFSTSHSGELIAIIIGKQKVAIDIEEIKERDSSLLSESGCDDWTDFYLQWTAKECVVKFLDLQSDDLPGITVLEITPSPSSNEGELAYCQILSSQGKKYAVQSYFRDNYAVSYSH
ncbi:MAG: 4'-phosphopantetheinyl transferase superfamily protein [Candidatus Absconditabacteria bacterium]|nr:4'-phosphopantetheinyl transferase superfamily protein [Candidatus Absconditabacteria bacterium]MDD3868648.1 4'-phosphopantetheinyl transferase superfamily protein [Candidatus Absconditabacteria bacterium]MDD4714502.1 4'-phosphopantetheinyl transferase superfamily protein [Candidatus Absconditabacteria bacterium]